MRCEHELESTDGTIRGQGGVFRLTDGASVGGACQYGLLSCGVYEFGSVGDDAGGKSHADEGAAVWSRGEGRWWHGLRVEPIPQVGPIETNAQDAVCFVGEFTTDV